MSPKATNMSCDVVVVPIEKMYLFSAAHEVSFQMRNMKEKSRIPASFEPGRDT